MRCSFVPPYLLRQIAASRAGMRPDAPADGTGAATDARLRTLEIDEEVRVRRERTSPQAAAATGGFTVHTADNTATLPGDPVRTQDQPESGDAAVDEAWTGTSASLALWKDVYDRDSYDDAGARVSVTVHYERDYANAFWDGTQLVFGDGDGEVFERFTKPIDVGGHEFAHAVTEHTAGLVYRDQPGALNESVSDVFASCVKQRHLGQTAAEGDWLIGAGIFREGVNGKALRSMAEPGTAYDDPVLGKDPQPAHMDDYVSTTDDNGGVHINSGIPNRAFHLAAVAIGGTSAQGAGAIWYAALQEVSSTVDFAGFAAATVAAAGDHAEKVRKAWTDVGVTPGQARPTGEPGPAPAQLPTDPAPGGAPGAVEVRRSGGFMGRTTTGRVDLAAEGSRAAEVRDLLGRVDLRAARAGTQYPDMFTYTFAVDDGDPVTLVETDLDGDLRRLAALVLEEDDDSR